MDMDSKLGVPNKEVTWGGWYTLSNALHHALSETGAEFMHVIKNVALGHKSSVAQ